MLEWLKTILGEAYTEDIDKKISAEIGKAFVSKADFNAKNEANKTLQAQLSDRDKQLDDLKKIDAAGLQAEITKLQGENKTAKETYEKKLADMEFGYALDTALAGAKVKNVKAVRALLQHDTLKLDGGKILGLDDQLTKLKESDGYLFESDKPSPTFAGPTPGAISSGMDAIRAAAGLAPKTKT